MHHTDDLELGERLVSREPVVVRRRVIWGDCDPAQVVYTPRFADYAAAAVQWFWRVANTDGGLDLAAHGLLTPIKAMAFTFHRVLRPDDLFDMTVYVETIRNRTVDLLVEASGTEGAAHFSARFTTILVAADSFESRPIPSPTRRALESYGERFPALRGKPRRALRTLAD